jgi:hypothetical protein
MNQSELSKAGDIFLVTSGDSRLSANLACWPAQQAMEEKLAAVFTNEGYRLIRAHPIDVSQGHGFVSSQRQGMDIFRNIPKDAKLLFATAAWQYSHHVLPGMRTHQGPILTVANWSGQWPGLVGLLNLNGCLVKAGVPFSSLWSENFADDFFLDGIRGWLREGKMTHDVSHVRSFDPKRIGDVERQLGADLAEKLRERKAILGIFDEGCMGMYNAIIDDELMNASGLFKERLSQSALIAKMRTVGAPEAENVLAWLEGKGMSFTFGSDPATELTRDQVLQQCAMYIAAVRMAYEFSCDAIGIQYQQGLKDMAPASDLVEGLLNNIDRPPVFLKGSDAELFAGQPVVHFNEVDECAGVDALITNRCWSALGFDPSTTLHDVRWGEPYRLDGREQFIWLLQISGAAPPNHFVDGFKGASSERQPTMYFPLGGGTLKGLSKPGEIVWSRVFVEKGKLHADLGRGRAVVLPEAETQRRWRATTIQWPVMNAVFYGVTRNQFMARHRANHINVVYAPNAQAADQAYAVKAMMLHTLGIEVHLCGSTDENSFQ